MLTPTFGKSNQCTFSFLFFFRFETMKGRQEQSLHSYLTSSTEEQANTYTGMTTCIKVFLCQTCTAEQCLQYSPPLYEYLLKEANFFNE